MTYHEQSIPVDNNSDMDPDGTPPSTDTLPHCDSDGVLAAAHLNNLTQAVSSKTYPPSLAKIHNFGQISTFGPEDLVNDIMMDDISKDTAKISQISINTSNDNLNIRKGHISSGDSISRLETTPHHNTAIS